MPSFKTEYNTIFYRTWPSSSPRAQVVFIHGFGEHTGHYDRLAAALNAAGITVWGIDQPGHGQSTGERGRCAAFEPAVEAARQILAMTLAASGDLPTVLMGHSLGGTAVALLACRQKLPATVRGLVLTGTVLTDSAYTIPAKVTVTEDPDYLRLLAEDPYRFDVSPAILKERRDLTSLVRKEIEAKLPALDVPMLLISGELDTIAPARFNAAFAPKLKQAQFHSFVGGHHDILNDRMHGSVAQLVAGFVTRLAVPA